MPMYPFEVINSLRCQVIASTIPSCNPKTFTARPVRSSILAPRSADRSPRTSLRSALSTFSNAWSLEQSLLYHRNLDASQSSGSCDPAPPLLGPVQARLSFGSGLLTLFTRSQDPSHQKSSTFNEGPERPPPPQARGPESVTHCTFTPTPTDEET
jgi:hypothetical protein